MAVPQALQNPAPGIPPIYEPACPFCCHEGGVFQGMEVTFSCFCFFFLDLEESWLACWVVEFEVDAQPPTTLMTTHRDTTQSKFNIFAFIANQFCFF
ncbi:hypothetical protein A7Q09_09760 [Methylacidiphilum sp. Yel]|nr:hypothetical protein A7Q09_09760 [Methylacidiphilum sp. Yel]